MKSPFTRLRGLVNRKHNKHNHDVPRLDELSQASKDMNEMKDCFDSLLSAAAATTNSVYEFSESLREMGGCLLEKTSLNDDHEDETGKVLLMLGKAQYRIQDLVDNYRSHITHTITVPSESLLNELRIVEEMKKQCDHKRALYDEMKIRHKHRRRLGSNKGEYVSSSQLKAAQEELEDDSTLFVFRIKSLKGSQSRSLLTQAARHHAAQTSFFRKALKSLEAIEPHIKLVTEQQHIDYEFSGLEDDDRDSFFLTDDEDCEEDDSDYATEYGELSFDYKRNDPKVEVSSSDNSMELDSADITFPQISPQNSVKVNVQRKPLWNSSTFNIGQNACSKSAPLSAMCNTEPGEKFRQMRQSSARRLNTYVLPTPLPKATSLDAQRPSTTNMWHSSPLDCKKYETKDKFSGPLASNTLKQTKPSPLPSPQIQIDTRSTFSAKKIKRYAFSGPMAPTAHSNNSSYSVSGPIGTTRHPPLQFSGSLFGTSLTRPASTTKLSSSPKISELHELPRPPPTISIKKPSQAGFSAPLMTFKDVNVTNKSPRSTLPVPAESQNIKAAERMVSPPRTPVSTRNS